MPGGLPAWMSVSDNYMTIETSPLSFDIELKVEYMLYSCTAVTMA